MKKLNEHIPGRISDELYNKSIGYLKTDKGMKNSLTYKTLVIHLIDSVSRGYTSPMEAYDALKAPYMPIWVTTRESAYSHLV